MLFKSSPLNATQYAIVIPKNGDRIVAIDSLTTLLDSVGNL